MYIAKSSSSHQLALDQCLQFISKQEYWYMQLPRVRLSWIAATWFCAVSLHICNIDSSTVAAFFPGRTIRTFVLAFLFWSYKNQNIQWARADTVNHVS